MSGEKAGLGNRKGPAKEVRKLFRDDADWRPSLIDYQRLMKRIEHLESAVAQIVKARIDGADDGR